MTNENKRAILSQKYMEVIATMNGYTTKIDPIDHTAIQIKEMAERILPKGRPVAVFTNREINGIIVSCTENDVKLGKGTLKFSIEPAIYNEVLETTGHQRPTVLLFCVWPQHEKGAIIFSKEAMSMICTCYWFLPSKKAKPATGTISQTVEVSEDQVVDTIGLQRIFENMYV